MITNSIRKTEGEDVMEATAGKVVESSDLSDGAALAGWLESRHWRIFAVCHNVLQHRADSEDAAQEVAIEVVAGAEKIRNADNPDAWLYKVAFHTALDFKRRKAARRSAEDALPPGVEAVIPDDAEIRRNAVMEALARLDDDGQRILVEHYLDGKTLAEIATSRCCSTVAVWKRVGKARQALKVILLKAGALGAAESVNTILSGLATARALATGVVPPAGAAAAVPALLMSLWRGMAGRTASWAVGVVIGALLAAWWLQIPLPFLMSKRGQQPDKVIEAKEAGREADASRSLSPSTMTAASSTTAKATGTAKGRKTSKRKGEAAATRQAKDTLTGVPSLNDYFKRFHGASELADQKQRWQELRKLEIDISFEDFAELDTLAEKMMKEAGNNEMDGLGGSKLRYKAYRLHGLLFDKWMKTDPASAMDWIRRFKNLPSLAEDPYLTESQMKEPYEHIVFSTANGGLAKSDFVYGDESPATVFYAILLSQWARSDQQAVLAWAGGLTNPQEREEAFMMCNVGANEISRLVDNGSIAPAEALGLLRGESAIQDFDAATAIVSKWTATNLPEAVDWLNNTELDVASWDGGRYAVQKIFSAWIGKDFESAARWATELSPDNEVDNAKRCLVAEALCGNWARNDPEAAIEWWLNNRTAPSSGSGNDIDWSSFWALDALIGNWKDKKAARQWLKDNASDPMVLMVDLSQKAKAGDAAARVQLERLAEKSDKPQ